MGPGLDGGASARLRPSLARRAFLLLLAAQALSGLFWLGRNLGDVPQYSDSLEYVRTARTLEIDAYRGIAYPLFLAAIDRLVGGVALDAPVEHAVTDEERSGRTQRRGRARANELFEANPESRQAALLQLVQLAALAGSLFYFLRTFVAPLGGSVRTDVVAWLLIWALLLADPLLGHLQLAVLTDGLALSASLVSCAALVRLALGRGRPAVHGTALFLAAFLASSLRVEKTWVLAGTVLGSLGLWWLAERSRAASERALSPARALRSAGIALAGLVAALVTQRAFRAESERMPAWEFMLDQRVLFPHLAAVYGELPADVRSRLSLEEAREHDQDVVVARRTIEALGGGDAALRRELIESSARVVVRERWPWIALDVVRDTAESAAATLSLYGRLGVLASIGMRRYGAIPGDYTRWTYVQMSVHHPWTTRVHLGLSGLSFVACSVLALVRVRRGAPRVERALRLAWIPVGTFVLVNALVFALSSGLVHPRYAVFAHAALLALLYRGALGWAAAENDARAKT
jgi:hypothetical protein